MKRREGRKGIGEGGGGWVRVRRRVMRAWRRKRKGRKPWGIRYFFLPEVVLSHLNE